MAKKNNLDNIIYLVIFLVLVLSIFNIFVINKRFVAIENAKIEMAERLRAADLVVTMIVPSNCDDCYDISLSLDELKKQNVNVTQEERLFLDLGENDIVCESSDCASLTNDKAQSLISQYNLEKLPAIIITGEVNKSEQLIKFLNDNGMVLDNSTAIFTNVKPPYYVINENNVVGRVSVINILDSSCAKCTSLLPLTESLKEVDVIISSERNIEYDSDEAKSLIEEHQINAIPAVMVSDDIEYYTDLSEQLANVGLEKSGEWYVVGSYVAPYRNLTQNKIIGLVDLITINDTSCLDCYDVEQNKIIVDRLGVVLNSENTYDVNSARANDLIKKYNIAKVPLILLSPEASEYPRFVQAWRSVGTIENDGWFVMTKPDVLGTYRDLSTGEVVLYDE